MNDMLERFKQLKERSRQEPQLEYWTRLPKEEQHRIILEKVRKVGFPNPRIREVRP